MHLHLLLLRGAGNPALSTPDSHCATSAGIGRLHVDNRIGENPPLQGVLGSKGGASRQTIHGLPQWVLAEGTGEAGQ